MYTFYNNFLIYRSIICSSSLAFQAFHSLDKNIILISISVFCEQLGCFDLYYAISKY